MVEAQDGLLDLYSNTSTQVYLHSSSMVAKSKKTTMVALKHVRALILKGVLDAMRITPIVAMGILIEIEPSGMKHHQAVMGAVAAATHRLAYELK